MPDTIGPDEMRARLNRPAAEAAQKDAAKARNRTIGWRNGAVLGTVVALLVGFTLGRVTAPGGASTAGAPATQGQSATAALPADQNGQLDNPRGMASFITGALHGRATCIVGGQGDGTGVTRATEDQTLRFYLANDGGGVPADLSFNSRSDVNLRWAYSDRLTGPLPSLGGGEIVPNTDQSTQWQEALASYLPQMFGPNGVGRGCDTGVLLMGPDWEGAFRAAMDNSSYGGVPLVLGADAHTSRFGDVCSGSCGSGLVYSVVGSSVYVWKNGKWQSDGSV